MDSLTFKLKNVVKYKPDNIEDFVGPIDLILQLLSKNKIEIKDIMISDLVQQYVDYVDKMKSFDIEVASEFATMASYLVYLKTRMLLAFDEETKNEMDELIKTLEEHKRKEEYKKIQRSLQFFKDNSEIGRNTFVRRPSIPPKLRTYTFVHPIEDIFGVLVEVLKNASVRQIQPVEAFVNIVGHEPYPVEKKSDEILKRLSISKKVSLKDMFNEAESKSEVVAVFLAILDLLKNNKIDILEENDGYMFTMKEGETIE